MTSSLLQAEEQEFLNGLEKKLWTSANKLLPSLDASQYKHVMLGLVFIKYVSDAFQLRQDELKTLFQAPDSDEYLDPADFEGGADGDEYKKELELEVEPLKKEIAFLGAVKNAITKFTTVDKKRTDEEKNSALKQIIDNAIVAEGVDDIFKLVGLDKPNIGLLSAEFLEDVANMSEKNLAVDLLEKLLRDEVKHRMKTDVVSEKKYSDRIMDTLRKYHNRAIETAQVIEELIKMAKDMADDAELAEKSGLSPDEVAFYRALIQNESAVKELGDDKLRSLAVFVTEQLRKSTTVDWQVRDSVRAKLRNLVRRALRKWKYPPDDPVTKEYRESIDLVMQQAEALSQSWSS